MFIAALGDRGWTSISTSAGCGIFPVALGGRGWTSVSTSAGGGMFPTVLLISVTSGLKCTFFDILGFCSFSLLETKLGLYLLSLFFTHGLSLLGIWAFRDSFIGDTGDDECEFLTSLRPRFLGEVDVHIVKKCWVE